MEKRCVLCNELISKKPKWAWSTFNRQIYCSKSCKGKVQGFQKTTKEKKDCIICGKQFEKINHPASAWKVAKFCSQDCYHKSRFVQDRTKLKSESRYIYPEYRGWRMNILRRDFFKCKMCSSKTKLEVHHILSWKDFPELRYEMNNGITLCHEHHPRKKQQEIDLAPLFKTLI